MNKKICCYLLFFLYLFCFQEIALALPSFARQTGMPCGSCHTDFPQLTPIGRQFKLTGYTLGAENNIKDGHWIPPIAFMAQEGFTHTEKGQDSEGTDLKSNNNFQFQSASIFYGGAITDHIGAFIQGTYNAPGFGPPPEFEYSWDSTDIRFAKMASIDKVNFIYGITINNNPTVQDVWNTVPAWDFPWISSNLAPTPSAAPILDNAFAASVLGGGLYTYINDLVYIEGTVYKNLTQRVQKDLGIDPTDTPGLFEKAAPYFRVAVEPHWGKNYLEIGTFGLYTEVNPEPWNYGKNNGTDRYFDVGFDSQYQYMGSKYSVTLRNTVLLEAQDLNASQKLNLSSKNRVYLNSFNTQASFVYGEKFRLPLTFEYFNTWGTEDELLYADNRTYSPDSSGIIGEIAFIPFGMTKAPIWPWLNARIGLQYWHYFKFNGAADNYDRMGRDAQDNDTLFAYIWLLM